jgi:hypothetical protein
MSIELRKAFESIGAQLVERYSDAFEIDIVHAREGEAFQLRYPFNDSITSEAMDIRPRQRHLVLDVFGWRLPISARYLCGHDEYHWFVAGVPINRRTATVCGAMEALKPAAVLREQNRKRVKHRRYRRKTAAYVRQGEWFFLARPNLQVDERFVEHRAALARNGGKPHRVEWLYRLEGTSELFARGYVSHPDHSTIVLETWHRVLQNNEEEPTPVAAPFIRMAYVD